VTLLLLEFPLGTLNKRIMRTQKALYLITSLAFPAANYITLPLFIQSTSVEEFGYYFLLLSVVNMASLLIGFGLVNTINAYYFYWSRTNSVKYNFANISLLVVAHFGLAAVVLSLLYYLVLNVVGLALANFQLLISIIFLAAMLYIKDMLAIFFRIDNGFHKLILLNIILVVLDTTLKIGYLKTFEFKVEYYLFLAAASIFATYGLVYLAYIVPNFRMSGLLSKKIKVYYRYNIGMFKSNVLGRAAALSDRPLVAIFLSDYDLGIYALAHRFASTLSSARSLIKNVWIADALDDVNKNRLSRNNLYFLWGFVIITFFAILIVPVYSTYFLDLSHSFDFYFLVFLFFIVNNVWVYYYFHSVFIISSRDSSHMPKVQIFASSAYFFCLPLLGVIGLYAIALAQLVQVGVIILSVRHYYGSRIRHDYLLSRKATCAWILLLTISLLVASETVSVKGFL
jgi:O-antigen/teichoic acid export membrane protein